MFNLLMRYREPPHAASMAVDQAMDGRRAPSGRSAAEDG
jgi:hypothetical protein